MTSDLSKRGQRRVLVVDDNAAAVQMLRMILNLLGHEVRTASDGQEGTEIAAAFLPHVVLMNLGMPRMNGFDPARHIREQPWGNQIMLIAVSGWGENQDRQRSKEVGFDQHLVNPAKLSEIKRLIQESKQ